MRVAASLAVALVLAGGAPAVAAEDCTPRQTASLQMTVVSGAVAIPVAINGQPRLMMISPGLAFSSLTLDYALSAGLQQRPVQSGTISVGGLPATTYAKVDTLLLGGSLGQKITLLIVPLAALPPIAGSIGSDLLANFDVEFDFAAHKVNFYLPNPCDGAGVTWSAQHGEVPLNKQDGRGNTDMTLDGENVHVTYDMLDAVSLMPSNVAKKVFNVAPAAGEPGNRVHTFTRLAQDGFAISPLTLHLDGDPEAPLCDGRWHTKMEDTYDLRSRCRAYGDVSLGRNELEKFHLYFAFKAGKLYFTPADAH